jgi:tRNA dimethylallyltransferase
VSSVPKIHIITGPTAVGKTAHALAWAEAHEAEIVSCDALLLYRGMDIGTAKPTPAEQARVPHHGIDVWPVDQPGSVVDYVRIASEAVESIHSRGKSVVVVGGSGFYLKAFFAPVADQILIDAAIKSTVAEAYTREGLAGLVRRLHALNPEGLNGLDILNPRRVIPALERCLASGKTLAGLRAAFARQPSPFAHVEKHVTLLQREEADLLNRVETRTRAMLKAGLVDEVKQLRAAGLESNPAAASAIGYRETLVWLDAGSTDYEALAQAIITGTRRLIKKQRTWFRHQLPVDVVLRL